MPKHKMPKHKRPLPSNFDHSFSNKRSMGILPAGSISQNQLSKHQQQFCDNNKLKLFVVHGDCSISILSTEEEEEKYETEKTYCEHSDFGCPVASCHELVLVACDEYCEEEELVLYNPSTKVRTTLPRPPRPPPSVVWECTLHFYGLGLDPKSNDDDDYKVIRCLEFKYDDDGCDTAAGFMGYRVVELYSLKTDSWKRIPYPHDNTPLLEDPIYINGFNYWVVSTGPENDILAILSFDFAKESFPSALIPGPPNEAYFKDERHEFLLAEYEGLLALVVCDKHKKQQIVLWVWNFDNRSWSRQVWAVGVDVKYPYAFVKNHLFYFEDSKGELVVFNSATQKLKNNHCDVEFVSPFLTRST